MDRVTLTSFQPAGGGEPVPVAIGATALGVVRVVTGPGAVAARFDDNDAVPADWVEDLCRALAGDEKAGHNVPIDWDGLGASDLERRIWNHLRGVASGGEVTPAEVAEAVTTDVDEAVGPIPQPSDVLKACAKDPIPALIPCERVDTGGVAMSRSARPGFGGQGRRRTGPPRRRGLAQRLVEGAASVCRLVVAVPVLIWYFGIKKKGIGW